MAEEHDKTHRLLFGFAEMIENLIRLCLPGPWIDFLEFSSLEQVSERFVEAGGDMKRKEADLIWRLRYRGAEDEDDWFYIYLNLEHMSGIRHFMALDTEQYRLGAWQQIVRNDAPQLPDGLLPPLLSIVFYNGDREWRPKMLPELVKKIPDAPPGFELGTFVLIDAQRWEVTTVQTPLEALFKLEQVDSVQDVQEATRQAHAAVGSNTELSTAFVALLNNVVFRKLAPADQEPLRIETLEETSMLEQRIERIAQRLILQGETQGLREGELRGFDKGQASLFLKLFHAKFKDIPPQVQERVAAATHEELEVWAERLLTCDHADDVFAEP